MVRSLLAGVVLAVTGSVAFAQPAKPPASGKYWAFFGGYTGGNTGGKGIYRSELDVKTGKLTEPELAVEVGSPSFFTIDPTGKFLYAIGEAAGGKDGGGVYAFSIDAATGKLTKLNQLTSGGAGPCHISTDKSGKFAIVANYGGGSCAVFKIKADGSLEARTSFVQHKGSSVDKSRQTAPHAHCGFFDETGNYAFVADLGLDQVLVYKLNRETGEITPHTTPFIKLPDGAGPRHFHIAPSNDLMFVCGELNSTANVVKMDIPNGKFEVTQSLSTLPKPTPGNSTAECRIHPNGKFVYVSNRVGDSIAAFKNDNGKLTAIGHATEGIKIPRNFAIEPTGQWMLVANQDGNSVVVFQIGEDGVPKPTGNKINVPKPVCVKFLAKP